MQFDILTQTPTFNSVSATRPNLMNVVKDVPNYGLNILNYDLDNLYPQRVQWNLANSATGAVCQRWMRKFILGRGLRSEVSARYIVNRYKETFETLVTQIADDVSTFNGFALHVNFYEDGTPASVMRIPFPFCRLTIPDEETGEINQIAYNANWNYSNFEKQGRSPLDITYYTRFDPDTARTEMGDILEAGGTAEDHKGHILYFSMEGDRYPDAPAGAALGYLDADGRHQRFVLRSVRNGLLQGHVLTVAGMLTPESKRQIVTNFNATAGDDNAAGLLILDDVGLAQDGKPASVLQELGRADSDGFFKTNMEATQAAIRNVFGVPVAVYGDLVSGKLGTSEEIENGVKLYNLFTSEYRAAISRVLRSVMPDFIDTELLPFEWNATAAING